MPKKSAKRRKHHPKKRPVVFELSERENAIIQNWQSLPELPPKLTAIVEGCGMSTVYERLAAGEYEALKDGSRTRITTESIKARRAGLPRAEYKPPTPVAAQT